MKTILLALSATLITGVAAAQEQGPSSGFAPNAGAETPGFVRELKRQTDITRLVQQSGQVQDHEAPVRAERAERLAALVNAGQCRAAIGRARVEGDNAMADRLKDVCDL